MAWKPFIWATDHVPAHYPDLSPTARHVLLILARHANQDGHGSYPSVPTIATKTGRTERSVRRALAELNKAGHIRPGDQNLANCATNRRPKVWDLAMETDPTPNPPGVTEALPGVTPEPPPGVTPATAWGDSRVPSGVTPEPPKEKYLKRNNEELAAAADPREQSPRPARPHCAQCEIPFDYRYPVPDDLVCHNCRTSADGPSEQDEQQADEPRVFESRLPIPDGTPPLPPGAPS